MNSALDLKSRALQQQCRGAITAGEVASVHLAPPERGWKSHLPFVRSIIATCRRSHTPWSLELPVASKAWQFLDHAMSHDAVRSITVDLCMFGAARKHRLKIVGELIELGHCGAKCRGRHTHRRWTHGVSHPPHPASFLQAVAQAHLNADLRRRISRWQNVCN